MSSPPLLDDVLTRLLGSRQRLLELADARRAASAGTGHSEAHATAEDLVELSEQLMVADEELRVQQAELDDARIRLRHTVAERDALWVSSVAARVVTDLQGVVTATNHAADALVRRPAARSTPRPIASWFTVGDRSDLRAAVGRLAGVGGATNGLQTLHGSLVRRGEASAPVEVTVEVADRGDHRVLLWELTELTPATVGSHTGPADRAGVGVDLAHTTALASLATRLATLRTSVEVLDAVIAAARELFPGCDDVAVSDLTRDGLRTQPGSSPLLEAFDRAQDEFAQGPLLDAVRGGTPVVVPDLHAEPRWPRLARRVGLEAVVGVLVVPLPAGPRRQAALTWSVPRADTFDDVDVTLASAFAAHVAVAVARAHDTENLGVAVASRQQIGEAVGVLVERHRVTTAAAFELLVHASQNSNTKLREVARLVVETGEEPHLIRVR